MDGGNRGTIGFQKKSTSLTNLVTHQVDPMNHCSVLCISIDFPADRRTPCVKLMTTHGRAWWVKKGDFISREISVELENDVRRKASLFEVVMLFRFRK